MFKKKEKSYKRFLIMTIVLVVIVPLIVNSGITLWLNGNSLRDSIMQRDYERSEAISREIDRLLSETERLMATLASDEGVSSMNARDMSILNRAVENSSIISQIYVMNPKGMQIYKTSGDLGDRADRSYFKDAIKGEKAYDIIYSSTTGKATAVLAMPIQKNGRVSGVIGASIDLEILTTLIERYNDSSVSYPFIVEKSGTVLAHPNASYVESMENFSKYDYVAKALSGAAGVEDAMYEDHESIVAYTPVTSSGWAVVMQSPKEFAYKSLTRLNLFSGFSLAVWVLIALGLGIFLSGTIFKNIAYIESVVLKLSGGHLNFHMDETYLKRKDEFGVLANELQQLIEEYNELLSRLLEDMNYIEGFTVTLHEISGENAKATEEMTEQIVGLSTRAAQDMSSMKGTFEMIEGMSEGANLIAVNTETLNETVKFNLDETDQSFKLVAQTVEQMLKVSEISSETNCKMKALKTSAEDIGGISEAIKSISEQTNLLALNASIEAARAGEAGRGFAVVAEEIRKLAEQSNDSADKITGIIFSIQREIEDIYKQFELIEIGVNQSSKSSEEAKVGMTRVIEISRKANVAVEEIAAVTEEQAASMTEISNSMEQFEQTLETTSDTTTHISAIAQEQMASTEQILNMIDELRTLADALVKRAEKFELNKK